MRSNTTQGIQLRVNEKAINIKSTRRFVFEAQLVQVFDNNSNVNHRKCDRIIIFSDGIIWLVMFYLKSPSTLIMILQFGVILSLGIESVECQNYKKFIIS